ncbi:MAG: T9SS type A sorting domain-containing protein [Candidatus Latescibacteria bacterium]|nr:T9SS type A sorting domain-containing protein [Candidatus Latescibacterota bacterium]
MRTNTSRRPRCCSRSARTLAALALVSTGLFAPAWAQLEWTNHIDASMVNDIVHKDGVLYMATFGGLLVYDVSRGQFEQFDNVDGLPSNALNCLVFDAEDYLYIGTADFGIAKVRFSSGRPVLVRALNEQIDGLSSNTVNSIAPWGTDLVYGANPGAGTIRNDFASARYFERDGLPDDDVGDVLPDGDFVWIATNAGVAVLDRNGFLRRPTGAPAIANVLGTDGATIWVGTNDGVWQMDPSDSSWTDVGPDAREMYGLFWDGTTMWGGSTRNFFRYTGGQNWDLFSTTPIASGYGFGSGGAINQIRGLAVASDGNVYLGSIHPSELRGVNVIRFDGTNQVNLMPNAPGGNDVKRLSVDVDGSVWAMFSPFYAGKLMPTGAWVNYNTAIAGIEVPSSQYTNLALLADSQGYKWFCSLPSPTLDRLEDHTDANYGDDVWARYALGSGGGDGLGSLSLQRGYEDPAGNRWFLSDGDGIQILSRDGSAWFEMTPTVESRMLSGDVVDVAFGISSVYVAHRELGIQRWGLNGGFDFASISDTALDTWGTPLPGALFSDDVFGIELRSDGKLWIATAGGLFRYPPRDPLDQIDEFPVYRGISAGILTEKCQDILLDHNEDLWVASNLGLNKIGRDDDGDVETYTSAATYVTALAGLRYPLSIISPLSNADCWSLAMHPTEDILYIGTIAGVTALDYTPPPAAETDLSRVYLYPNPVYRSRGHNEVMIQNITGPVSIEVYNLEGVLVHSQTVDANGQVAWDLTTETGFIVGSGNYLVRVVGSGGAVTKTIAVLR